MILLSYTPPPKERPDLNSWAHSCTWHEAVCSLPLSLLIHLCLWTLLTFITCFLFPNKKILNYSLIYHIFPHPFLSCLTADGSCSYMTDVSYICMLPEIFITNTLTCQSPLLHWVLTWLNNRLNHVLQCFYWFLCQCVSARVLFCCLITLQGCLLVHGRGKGLKTMCSKEH